MEKRLPRILLAAERSGSGKTTLVCALLQALCNRGLTPAACKCGPDYIDPLFHSEIIGTRGSNIDLFFTQENLAKQLLWESAEGCDVAVLEGVMGYYDGVGGTDHTASSYHVAHATDTPVVLVLDVRGASLSLCAAVKGFLEFRSPSQICGVILNRCTASLYSVLSPMLEQECGISVLGYMPYLPECALESRHLGLVTAAEVDDIRQKLQTLAAQIESSVNIDHLLQLAQTAPPLHFAEEPVVPATDAHPRIALARDRAFCFYYRESLALLEKLGAELVTFSPLHDMALPKDIDALYLGGGYPELYAEQLSNNTSMLDNINKAIAGGLPTIAECGGFLYLHSTLTNQSGRTYPMVDIIKADCHDTGRLSRFGYITLTAERGNLLCSAGERIAGHEFHYYDSTVNGNAFTAKKPKSNRSWQCIHGNETLFTGFPHLYLYANKEFARRFVTAAAQYSKQRK
ncbi:MAG: cobyrinate a,c-diamide synthase [Angelakisella sp.]